MSDSGDNHDQNQLQNNPPSRQGSPAGGHGDEEIGPQHPEFGIAFSFQIPPSFSRVEALEINRRLARARLLQQTGVPADVVVPEEEEEQEVPQTPGKRKRNEDLFALASLMSQASPGTRRAFENLLFPDSESKRAKVSGPKPPTATILQSSGASKPSHRASVLNDAFIAPYKDTLRLKHYMPLTAFLTSTIKAAAKSGKVEMQTIYVYSDNSTSMSKAYVMDASQFPDEEKMKFEEWIEAYSNFTRFLAEPGVACANTVDLFRAHFKILSTHPHATSLFPAVIDIDMWYRRYILTVNNEHPEAEYREQIATIDAAHRAARSISWQPGGNVASGSSVTLAQIPDTAPPPAPPAHGYGSGGHGGRGGRGRGRGRGGFPSFQREKKLVCLMCGDEHHFASCTAEKTKKGKPIFAKRDPGGPSGIVRRSNGAVICSSWNLSHDGRYTRCPNNHPEAHICSICGSNAHNAISGNCPAA
ncbi:hypothetical protein BKA70DRAFT_1455800 [Coprinopsis sp. MPI-PUGE-AT-0042]|nr:hypothetical protein BKA70DRAFT_1493233 [Coprinopsis sp. MPI-PUGE-AT-0042]KAH6917844.1 hypothetical protein BKA70DRAFT_1455800 [Coprinopsis sp. MPI-PUGE-AT-0042]